MLEEQLIALALTILQISVTFNIYSIVAALAFFFIFWSLKDHNGFSLAIALIVLVLCGVVIWLLITYLSLTNISPDVVVRAFTPYPFTSIIPIAIISALSAIFWALRAKPGALLCCGLLLALLIGWLVWNGLNVVQAESEFSLTSLPPASSTAARTVLKSAYSGVSIGINNKNQSRMALRVQSLDQRGNVAISISYHDNANVVNCKGQITRDEHINLTCGAHQLMSFKGILYPDSHIEGIERYNDGNSYKDVLR